jgi:thymidylate synthase (FAD)
MTVKLISITKGLDHLASFSPEELIVYCARVSNPENQLNKETAPKLLAYCLKQKHWSVFEHCNFTVEITTSRMISAQLVRHRSFVFSEFSQRYAKATDVLKYEARKQDVKNRQNSTDDLSVEDKKWFKEKQEELANLAQKIYHEAIGKNIAKECARVFLPMSTKTTLYMTGSVRSWITYLLVRLEKSTQLEHRQIAQEVWKVFKDQFPNSSIALQEMYPEVFLERAV